LLPRKYEPLRSGGEPKGKQGTTVEWLNGKKRRVAGGEHGRVSL